MIWNPHPPARALEDEFRSECAEEVCEVALVREILGALIARLKRVYQQRLNSVHHNSRATPTEAQIRCPDRLRSRRSSRACG